MNRDMAIRIYPDEATGDRYQFKTSVTDEPGVMRLAITSTFGGQTIAGVIEVDQLREIRRSGSTLALSAAINVHYRVVSGRGGTRIGYLFEFSDGLQFRTVLVHADSIAWLLDADPSEAAGSCVR